jgi:hypothetical protein
VLGAGVFDADDADSVIATNGALEYHAPRTLYRANAGLSMTLDRRDEQAFFQTRERFLVDEESDRGELGANIEHKISSAFTARIDALQAMEKKTRLAGPIAATTNTDSTIGETNLRGALAWRPSPKLSVEGGAEWAFNYLDQQSTLTTANANVRVEEKRAQPFVTTTFQLIPRTSLEIGARYETSTITQSGGSALEKKFDFWKPRVIAAIDITDSTQVRLRAERDVKQLDFADFAATGGVNIGSASAGNAALKPENSWVYEAVIEKNLGKGSTLSFTYEHQDVSDTLDYVVIGGTDGHGNIGDSKRDKYQIDGKIALDGLGVRGGRIEFNPQYYSSSVVDPFIGSKRQITGGSHFRGRFFFYLDKPELRSTFTFEFRSGYRERTWRRNQMQTVLQDPIGFLSWDWSPKPGLSVRTTVNAIANRQRWWTRDIYAGDRGASPIAYREVRYTEQRPNLMVRLRKEF